MGRPHKNECNAADTRLIDAFWICLEAMRLQDITISIITKNAKVNRGTFYYHFRDMDELVERAIEREFRSQELLPSIFDLITGTPGSAPAVALAQQRMQHTGLLIDRGGLDVLSSQIKQLVRQMWTAVLCDEGEQLKPETLFIIEYTTSGIIGLIANNDTRESVQKNPDALNCFLKRNSAFLLEQIGNAQGLPRDIVIERIRATHRISCLDIK